MKRIVRNLVGFFAFHTGATALLRNRCPRPGAIILMFHRVRNDEEGYLGGVSPKHFARLIRYLSRYYHPISLSDLVRHILESKPVPENSVVLTFDDGFRDNYEHAFPILRDYSVPATVFLVTNSIETGALPWPQRVGFILQHTQVTFVRLKRPTNQTFPLKTPGQRRVAFREILNLRSRLALSELDDLATDLQAECGVDPPQDRMLTWDQVREMSQHGIEFGAHTIDHPMMAHLSTEEAWAQLRGSKETIENRLGSKVQHFCFPGGSISDELVAMAKQCDFASLYRPTRLDRNNHKSWLHRNVNTHESDPHALRRCGVQEFFPAMAAELAGVSELVRSCDLFR